MQTSSAVKTFFYSMALNPEIQKKAQEEIDRVVGNQRLPDFRDRQSMPYTDAIYREVMRIRPVFPLGSPHATIEDDVYNGYFIPKGKALL
jgi:cytochrome P450